MGYFDVIVPRFVPFLLLQIEQDFKTKFLIKIYRFFNIVAEQTDMKQ